jgi:hypothetical protein
MPWGPGDASRFTKKANTPKRRRQFADVADSALARTGDEGTAIREANAAVKRSYRGPGRVGHGARQRTGKTRAWSGG